MPILIALGAALQAWIGCLWVRRFVAQPLTRAQPPDIWRILLLAVPMARLAKATIATAALGLVGTVPVPTLATQRARKALRGEQAIALRVGRVIERFQSIHPMEALPEPARPHPEAMARRLGPLRLFDSAQTHTCRYRTVGMSASTRGVSVRFATASLDPHQLE